MKMYAIYLRKSRADIIDNTKIDTNATLEIHEKTLIALAKHQNLPIGAIYREVVSGETIATRPVMMQLLSEVEQGLWEGVLVMEIERLARGDTMDQGLIAQTFKYSGTKIVTPTKTYDPQNEFDEEYFEFGLFMSRREYKTISRRMERGKIASVKEGNFIASKRPYGYEIIRPSRKEHTLKIIPEEAKYVRMIYEWFTQEKISAGEIARRLTRLGVPTYSGRPEWHEGTVNEMLKNPVYMGMVRWKYRPIVKEFNQEGQIIEKRARVSTEEMILAKGKHEPIITEAQFQAAQKRFEEEPARVAPNGRMRNPFSGLVYCSKCGNTLFYHDTKKSAGTRIRMTHRSSQICKVKSCFYDDFKDAVIDILQQHLQDFQIKLDTIDQDAHISQHNDMIKSLEQEILSINMRRERLFDLLERQIYSDADFLERKTALDEQKEKAEAELQELIKTKPEPIDYAEKIYHFKIAIDALTDDTILAEDKNKLLKTIIKRIEYTRIDDDKFKLDITLR